MEMRSAFVVGFRTREGIQGYEGPFPREDQALQARCTSGAKIIYFDRPDSPGVDAWRAVNNRWERCPGWTLGIRTPTKPVPLDRILEFNREIQVMEAYQESRRKGTLDHLR